jgi:hypothetical protein
MPQLLSLCSFEISFCRSIFILQDGICNHSEVMRMKKGQMKRNQYLLNSINESHTLKYLIIRHSSPMCWDSQWDHGRSWPVPIRQWQTQDLLPTHLPPWLLSFALLHAITREAGTGVGVEGCRVKTGTKGYAKRLGKVTSNSLTMRKTVRTQIPR